MAIPVVSVIIPAYNRPAMLGRCLDSLAAQTFPLSDVEVIVVDDGSTEDLRTPLDRRHDPFRLRYMRIGHAGPSLARNAGIDAAEGTYIALTEDDMLLQPEWLEKGIAHLRIAGTDVVEGTTVLQSGGRPVRRFEPQPRPSFIPCNLMMKRSVFETCRGYDPEYFDPVSGLYFREDADFGFRLLDAGFKAVIAADVVGGHPGQFPDFASCARHARRYFFDPLLHRRHPSRYRELIEVKSFAGFSIHRPQHTVALTDTLAAAALPVALAFQSWTVSILLIVFILCCGMMFRFKYQGLKGISAPGSPKEIAGFIILPFIYMMSFLRGCRAFGNYRPLV